MAGIIRYGSYLPYFRLKRDAFGAGRGEKAVASYDEDAVSMAVEAAREALPGGVRPDALMLATTSPPYAEKANVATVAAALRLGNDTASYELGASSRMGLAALVLALDLAKAGKSSLVCASDVVIGNPGGPREAMSGDGAVAFLTGADEDAVAIARGWASATAELIDVWRLPEDAFARQWEERFGAEILVPVAIGVAKKALAQSGLEFGQIDHVIVDAANPRVSAGLTGALKLRREQGDTTLQSSAGRTGTAAVGLALAHYLDSAAPGSRVLVLSVVDGCDGVVFEVTDRIAQGRPARSVAHWLGAKRSDVSYHSYLKWRGIMPFEPPRRPEPERPAAPASNRALEWKMALVGGRCRSCGQPNLPKQQVCVKCGHAGEMDELACADSVAKVATYTIDHLAYSLQPPVVAAVVDFENGGRMSCELADVDPAEVQIGTKLEMTFRRFYTGQGIHNYFWKARPSR